MSQKPYLNLGCGRVILPAPKPDHYALIDNITEYALWHNVDRNAVPGVDETADLFSYPWAWADNSFDGALCAHLCEHIPHEIKLTRDAQLVIDNAKLGDDVSVKGKFAGYVMRATELAQLQDGWYAFFSELWRVLTPGAIIHVLSPYAWSDGAMHDPSHTRYLTPASFQHSMTPNPDAPFAYATGGLHLEMADLRYGVSEDFKHLIGQQELLERAARTQINVCAEFYVKLQVVK
jgi:hypothetical protein